MPSLGARAGGAAVAALLAAVGLGFAVAAVYLGWRELLPAPLAAAVTAACLFGAAGIVHLATRGPRRPAATASPLTAAALPLVGLVRDKPGLTLLGALGLGALLEQLDRRRK
jgi:hypothetical protein